MALTTIPTETPGSLGGDKTDRYPIPDTSDELRSAEWNVCKKAVAEIAAHIGLGELGNVLFFEDFAAARIDASRWDLLSAGQNETIAFPSQAPSEGCGWVRAVTNTTIGDVRGVALGLPIFTPTNNAPLTFEAKVKTHATLAHATMVVGLERSGGVGAVFEITTATKAKTASGVGGGTAEATITALLASTVYTLRIEIDATPAARFYVNGTLVHTATGTSVPRTTDELLVMLRLTENDVGGAQTAQTMVVDYVRVKGAR